MGLGSFALGFLGCVVGNQKNEPLINIGYLRSKNYETIQLR